MLGIDPPRFDRLPVPRIGGGCCTFLPLIQFPNELTSIALVSRYAQRDLRFAFSEPQRFLLPFALLSYLAFPGLSPLHVPRAHDIIQRGEDAIRRLLLLLARYHMVTFPGHFAALPGRPSRLVFWFFSLLPHIFPQITIAITAPPRHCLVTALTQHLLL